jgi:hypothetical protein
MEIIPFSQLAVRRGSLSPKPTYQGTWASVLQLLENPWMMTYGRPTGFAATGDPSTALAQMLAQFPEWPAIHAAAVASNLHKPGQQLSVTIQAVTKALMERHGGDQVKVRQLPLSSVASLLQKEVSETLVRQATEEGERATRSSQEVGSAKRRKPGRPRDTDPRADKRVFEAWSTRQHKTYEDLARELGITQRGENRDRPPPETAGAKAGVGAGQSCRKKACQGRRVIPLRLSTAVSPGQLRSTPFTAPE